jgi:hypothetical protein
MTEWWEDDLPPGTRRLGFYTPKEMQKEMRKAAAWVRGKHRFIRFGAFGKEGSKIGLDPEFMATYQGGIHDPHLATEAVQVYRESGTSMYFAQKKGSGWEPKDPDFSRAIYGAESGYWKHMLSWRMLGPAICRNRVYLVEGSLIPTTVPAAIEIEYDPGTDWDKDDFQSEWEREWESRWEAKEIVRRRRFRVAAPILMGRASVDIKKAMRALGGIHRASASGKGGWYYMPNKRLARTLEAYIEARRAMSPMTRDRSWEKIVKRERVSKKPAPPKMPPEFVKKQSAEVEVPDRWPSYRTGSDGEPVVKNGKIITRLDPFGDDPSVPRLYLPIRATRASMQCDDD